MMQSAGIWLPDNDQHMIDYFRVAPMIDGHGTYQSEKWRLAQRWVRQHRTAVDVGAHVGLWTMMLVKHFARVVCFEPMPVHRDCWLKNLPTIMPRAVEVTTVADDDVRRFIDEHNARRLELHATALGAEVGEAEIALERAGWSGCTRVIRPEETVALAGPKVRVPVARLDDFDLHDVDFLKVDCEGFERFVLQGGEQLLKRERPTVIVEQKPGLAQRFGLGETDAVAYLTKLGARVQGTMNGDYVLNFPEVPHRIRG